MIPAVAVLNGCVALIIVAAAVFSARYRLPRPPIGTYSYPDMLIIFAVVTVAPLTYMELPRPVIATIFGLVLLVAAQLALAPITGGRAAWLASAGLCVSTGAAALLDEPVLVIVLTDLLLTAGVIAVASLWAQSGMGAGHVAFFGALLTGYDVMATAFTSVMTRFFDEVQGLPFAPLFLVSHGNPPIGIGLGDLLMLVLFPLIAQRAFGRPAGLVAAAIGVAVTTAVGVLFAIGVLSVGVPLLTVLGPLIVAQYVFWRAAGRRQRRTWQWQQGLPSTASSQPQTPDVALVAALRIAVDEADPGSWLAVHEGRIVGTGATPGLARRSARLNGCSALPLVRRAAGLDAVGPTLNAVGPTLN